MDNEVIEAKLLLLQRERSLLVSMIDGVMPLVEIFKPESMAQKAWKTLWLELAHERIARFKKEREAEENGNENSL